MYSICATSFLSIPLSVDIKHSAFYDLFLEMSYPHFCCVLLVLEQCKWIPHKGMATRERILRAISEMLLLPWEVMGTYCMGDPELWAVVMTRS